MPLEPARPPVVVGRSKAGEVFSERKTSAGTMRVTSAESLAKAAKSAETVLRGAGTNRPDKWRK